MERNYTYSAHGLSICSYRRLPSLDEDENNGNFDVRINKASLDRPESGKREYRKVIKRKGETIIYWKNRLVISIRDGEKILVDQIPGSDDRLTGFLIIGTGLGVLLHQRQRITLHASGVVLDGDAIAFAGRKGMGKSTTAAAFMREGFPVVSDDVLSPIISDGKIFVYPSERNFKLFPDVASTILESKNKLSSLIHRKSNKKSYSMKSIPKEKYPLRRIYILKYSEDEDKKIPYVESMNTKKSYIEITKNSYALRFLGKKGLKKWYSNKVSFISNNLDTKKIVRKKGKGKLSKVIKRVLRDLK